MERFQSGDPLAGLEPVATPAEIIELQKARREIGVSLPVRQYIADIVKATRDSRALRFGASPRGALGLMRAGQALAALKGRTYVLPDDIKCLAEPVLAHRLILKEEELLRGNTPESILNELMTAVPVPVGE